MSWFLRRKKKAELLGKVQMSIGSKLQKNPNLGILKGCMVPQVFAPYSGKCSENAGLQDLPVKGKNKKEGKTCIFNSCSITLVWGVDQLAYLCEQTWLTFLNTTFNRSPSWASNDWIKCKGWFEGSAKERAGVSWSISHASAYPVCQMHTSYCVCLSYLTIEQVNQSWPNLEWYLSLCMSGSSCFNYFIW